MDYTNFLNRNRKYKLNIKNKYIKESIETLKDIKKAEYILTNHHRLNVKIDIDEYFAYFLKEKNDFILSFKQYILNPTDESNCQIYIQEDLQIVYKEILNILKSNLDNLIINFKLIKQNIYKKAKQQERFNEQKFIFFSEKEEGPRQEEDDINRNKSFKSKVKEKIKQIIPVDFDYFEEKVKEKYKEASHVVDMLMDKEKQDFEKTKRIIYELSSLMTSVQVKIHEHTEMTKNILINSLKSVENIEQGNKELKSAKEYQKGRGFYIGIICIILGLFLVLSDW